MRGMLLLAALPAPVLAAWGHAAYLFCGRGEPSCACACVRPYLSERARARPACVLPPVRAGASRRARDALASADDARQSRQEAADAGAPPLQPLAEPCNVVLTHANADFDSLASAVALAKLWSIQRPELPTHVVLPRGANPLATRFVAYHKHLLPIRGFNTINPKEVHALGIVDTQTRERLGPAAAWLSHAQHVAVYDHHLASDCNIAYDELVIEPTGSATTVLVEKLQAVSDLASLSETEATLLALGIRADTGALSYADTTPRDGLALVWLMQHGASQSAIAEFGQARLSSVQRDVLTEALSRAQLTNHQGLRLGVVFLHTGRDFVTGMARVAEELMDLGGYDVVLMGVVHEGAKGQEFLALIGRAGPRALTVDLAQVMQKYKGGGHPAAAAASVKLEQQGVCTADGCISASLVLDAVLASVLHQIPEQVTAADIMTVDVVSVRPDATMEDARLTMNEARLKGVPVVGASGELLGALKYKDVVKAAQAGKAAQRVKAWMRRQVVTISADMPFHELEEFLISRSIGRLPVVAEDGRLMGIITRTDILRQHNLYTTT